MIDTQLALCYIIRRAIDGEQPSMYHYDGSRIDSYFFDALAVKEWELWLLVDHSADLKDLPTCDCDKRNEVLATIAEDPVLLHICEYWMSSSIHKEDRRKRREELNVKLNELGLGL